MVTELELAYTAGILDGEGCIRANKQKSGTAVIRVHITNTDEILIKWLHQKFGGYVWKESKAYMENAKIRFVWELSSKKAEEFLKKVKPFLLIKKDRVELALRIQARKKQGAALSERDKLLEKEDVLLLSKLNKKGTKENAVT